MKEHGFREEADRIEQEKQAATAALAAEESRRDEARRAGVEASKQHLSAIDELVAAYLAASERVGYPHGSRPYNPNARYPQRSRRSWFTGRWSPSIQGRSWQEDFEGSGT